MNIVNEVQALLEKHFNRPISEEDAVLWMQEVVRRESS